MDVRILGRKMEYKLCNNCNRPIKKLHEWMHDLNSCGDDIVKNYVSRMHSEDCEKARVRWLEQQLQECKNLLTKISSISNTCS